MGKDKYIKNTITEDTPAGSYADTHRNLFDSATIFEN